MRFLWLLTIVPSLPLILVYLAFTRVLRSKRFELKMLLQRGETLARYLSAYGAAPQSSADMPSLEAHSEERIDSIVKQIFRLRYSLLEYLPALAFSVLSTSVLMVLAMSFGGVDLGLPPLLKSYLHGNNYLREIVAGGVGALIWGIYELCHRYRAGDLAPDVIFLIGARLLFVAAVGAIVGEFLNDRFAWTVAFGLGVLPVPAVRSFIADRTRRALNLPEPLSTEANSPLTAIQGWNAELADKLSRAGITSVQELACTNQFQLFLRSNLEWRIILDLSDQALLIIYVGEAIEKLRPLGIRSAVDLATIDWSRGNKEFFSGFSALDAVQQITEALGMGEQSVRLLMRSISNDATVKFLGALWSDDTPDKTGTDSSTPPADPGGPKPPRQAVFAPR